MNNSKLKSEVQKLIDEVNKTHRYSMSRIYGLYNEVFGTDETPQSCASCLIRKVKELRTWLDKEADKDIPAAEDTISDDKQAAIPAPAKTTKKRTKKDK